MASQNDTYHEFDDNAVQEAVSLARQSHQESAAATESGGAASLASATESGAMEIAAQCISVTVSNRRICLNLPLGIGRICLPVPSFVPNGTAAQACISICTTFGIPTGVRLTVTVAGNVILRKTFGKC